VNRQLCLLQAWFEEIPRGVVHQETFVQSHSKGSEVGGVCGCGGVKVGTEV